MANPNPRSSWNMHKPQSRFGQAFVMAARKIYHPVGFQKGYNFPLFVISAGALFGFACSRLMYFDYHGIFARDAIPGEFYYYRAGHYAVGIMLHIVTAVLGAFFAPFQFIPIIRYKFTIFHRINGYWATLLLVAAVVSAFMIMDVSIGGVPVMRVWTGVVGVMIIIGLTLAIVNIKRLQIEAHRMWMLRVWTWAGSIVTVRILLQAGLYVSKTYSVEYHQAFHCAKIFYMYTHVGVPDQGNPTPLLYPTCLNVTSAAGRLTSQSINPKINTGTWVLVSSFGSGPENAAASINNLFPMCAWLAIALHVVAIETYLWLTPAEHYRLRNVSYQRQVEAGMRPKGRFSDAGINATTFGDAPDFWSIPQSDYDEVKRFMAETTHNEKPGHVRHGSDTDFEGDVVHMLPRPSEVDNGVLAHDGQVRHI